VIRAPCSQSVVRLVQTRVHFVAPLGLELDSLGEKPQAAEGRLTAEASNFICTSFDGVSLCDIPHLSSEWL
jgi:hypothetical protein